MLVPKLIMSAELLILYCEVSCNIASCNAGIVLTLSFFALNFCMKAHGAAHEGASRQIEQWSEI